MSTIKPAPYNAIDFTSSFTRVGNTFDVNRQRVRNIIAPVTGVLSFEYIPGVMPDEAPDAHVGVNLSTGVTVETIYTNVIELTDRFIYQFNISTLGLVAGKCDFYFKIDGVSTVIYSEKCEAFNLADFKENNLVRIVAYNADSTSNYITSTYPACGFFEVSELDRDKYGSTKTIYKRSHERDMILKAEKVIKRRIMFLNLSMYQQNLLRFLCDLETLSINGTTYYLQGDLAEDRKDPESEICNLVGTFVPVVISDFVEGATEVASEIQPTNLFM